MEQYFIMFESYLTDQRKRSQNTVKSYISDLRRFAEYAELTGLTGKPWSIGKANIYDYISNMEETGVSAQTITRRISSLKSFYLFLRVQGIVKANPADGVDVPKTEIKPPSVLTVEEVSKLLNSLSGDGAKQIRDRAMIGLLYATGLRVSELLSLKTSDMNISGKYIKCCGRGGRIIPVGQNATGYLCEYIATARASLANDGEDALFVNISGNPMTRQGFWKIVRQYAEKTGIYGEISPKTLRHSFAAHMLANGAPLQTVKELLGHTELSATMVYAKYSESNNTGSNGYNN